MANAFLDNITKFEELLQDMKEASRESHEILKELKRERKEIERLLSTNVAKMVQTQVDLVVKTELDKIGPEIRKQTSLIYDRVGNQIDKLIAICLGREFARKHGHEDLRPLLGEKLREWIQEIITSEDL